MMGKGREPLQPVPSPPVPLQLQEDTGRGLAFYWPVLVLVIGGLLTAAWIGGLLWAAFQFLSWAAS